MSEPVTWAPTLERVPIWSFEVALQHGKRYRPLVARNCDEPTGAGRYYLRPDRRSGFGIEGTEIVCLFSRDHGLGDWLVEAAIRADGYRLNCFDGYLVDLYQRHGFVETSREPNWTPGGPDVVYMRRSK